MPHNKKGSPSRLGRPSPGQSRHPTVGELVCCGLRRNDLICSDEMGRLSIYRCRKLYVATSKEFLPREEARDILSDLEFYWSR